MKHPLNQQQTKAVAEFNFDLLVTAGAGTGKTSVLTSKFLRLLEERRAGVGEIVAITFTKKAAAEMRNRIQREIQEYVNQASTRVDIDFWKNQLLKMESARISTFHSFCLGLLQEHPLEVGIPPVTGILSNGEETIYLNRTIEKVLLEEFQENKQDKQALLDILLDFGWGYFVTNLGAVYQKIRESGQTFEQVIQFTDDCLRESIQQVPQEASHLICAVEEFLQYCQTINLTEHSGEMIGSFREGWRDQQELLHAGSTGKAILSTMNEMKKGLPKNVPNLIKDRIIEIHQMIELLTRKLLDQECLTRISVIGGLLIRVDRFYTSIKRELGVLDFTDQLVLVKDLLKNNPDLAAEIREKIHYLLVDEFQDTNSLQMEIVDLLVGTNYINGRFMAVGDIKQSIYRFRGAEADLILSLAERLQDKKGEIIPLTQNYRSNAPVIRFVNEIFTQLFKDETFAYEPLEAALDDRDSHSNIEFILTGSFDRQLEARMVAERVKQLVEESSGKLHYNDIVILFRASTSMPLYQQALQKLDIPYFTASGGGFYHRQEVVDQLNLLRLVEQRHHGIALLGLLTSPYVGLTDDSLLWLGEGRDLVERFYGSETYSEFIPPSEQIRLQKFRNVISYLQKNREYFNIPAIIRTALERSHYREVLWALPNAEQRLANLNKLLEKADEFVSKGFHDLHRFLEFIEKLEEVEVLEGEAQTQAETGDAVRLMTIHRAKGLEFPVVILADLDRQFPRPNQGKLAFHKAAGLGLMIQFGDGESGSSSVNERIKKFDKVEEFSELKRVLYVALTRAQRELIIVGSGSSRSRGKSIDTANSWMKWFELILPLEKAGPTLSYQGISIKITRELDLQEHSIQTIRILEDCLPLLNDLNDNSPAFEKEIAATGLAEIQSPITLKVSEVLAFKECARRYFLEYRSHINGELFTSKSPGTMGGGSGMGTTIGSFIHQAFQLRSSEWPEELWEETFGLIPDQRLAYLKADLVRMWQNFRQSQYTEAFGTQWDEVPFLIKLNQGVRIEGRFDRLLQSKNGELILIDYKTHRVNDKEAEVLAKTYFWQLQLYALAVKALWGRLPDRAELYFLYPNQVIPVSLDPESLRRITQEIEAIARFISEDRNLLECPKKNDCENCNYYRFCK